MADNKYLVGVFDDGDELLHAVEDARHQGVKIHEVYTPFAVHGLDRAMGYSFPRMGVAAFSLELQEQSVPCYLPFGQWDLIGLSM